MGCADLQMTVYGKQSLEVGFGAGVPNTTVCIYLSVYIAYKPIYTHTHVHLSIYTSTHNYLSVCLYVCISVCLHIYVTACLYNKISMFVCKSARVYM